VSAEVHYQQALALAEELGMRPLVAHCHHRLGRLYSQTGRREEARTELSAGIAKYRAMNTAFWLPQPEAALAQSGSVAGTTRSPKATRNHPLVKCTGSSSQSCPLLYTSLTSLVLRCLKVRTLSLGLRPSVSGQAGRGPPPHRAGSPPRYVACW
jgi:hypothetical protein